MSRRCILIVSDIHAGSTIGLLHPDGVQLDDGGWVYPGPHQLWMYGQYERMVDDMRELSEGYPTHVVFLGDMTEGVHHNTHQIISPDKGTHIQAAFDVLTDGVLTIPHKTIHMVRGTPAHVDRAAGLEKSLAAKLNHDFPIVRDPESNSFVYPVLQMELNGTLLDFKHHGRMSGREHLRKGYSGHYAFDIWASYHMDGRRPPSVAFRAHNHRFMDSGPDHRGVTRVVGTPCWQLSSEWVRRIAIETRPDLGGVCCFVSRTGQIEIIPLLYEPEEEVEPWRPDGDECGGTTPGPD